MTAGLGRVLPAGAREVRGEINGVSELWWESAPELVRDADRHAFTSRAVATYRLGDAVLQLDVDHLTLAEPFRHLYGDFAESGPVASGVPAVRCTMRRSFDPPLLVLKFGEPAPPDPAAAAYNLLRPTQAVPPYRVWDAPLPGWRLAGGSTGAVLAAREPHVLLHPKLIPPEFLAEYLVGITLGAQHWTLPIHGASLRMGDIGVVLVGASHAGKTTTALHLAARGHELLGDEIALVRLATGELVPFPRAVNVRPGMHGRELAAALGISAADANGADASAPWVGLHRISALFAAAPPQPTPLRAVFFLAGFSGHPSAEPFQLTLDHSEVFSWITTPEIAYCSWGVAPRRRALRLLVLRQLLSRLPCWLVKVGPPRDTVELIERRVEELAC